MDDTNQFLLSLHKYWVQANRMREDFIQEINHTYNHAYLTSCSASSSVGIFLKNKDNFVKKCA